MRHRLQWHWWPLLLVAVVSACDDDKTPGATGGSGASTADSGTTTTGGGGGTGGTGGSAGKGGSNPTDAGSDAITPPPGDGGLVPCLDLPTDLDRPPSGRLPCDLLPPGFVAP
ncbi:MAG TPA: hypothetical protein VK540_13295 [Polyangiaceae bacterium]|nr:hypothetical protein [Polyangiaceae bacterium]